MPVYHRICPHCQDLCLSFTDPSGEKFGSCLHPEDGFKYSFSESGKNAVILDITTDCYFVSVYISKDYKKTIIRSDNGSFTLENFAPIDWSNFELDLFHSKITKILQLQTFH